MCRGGGGSGGGGEVWRCWWWEDGDVDELLVMLLSTKKFRLLASRRRRGLAARPISVRHSLSCIHSNEKQDRIFPGVAEDVFKNHHCRRRSHILQVPQNIGQSDNGSYTNPLSGRSTLISHTSIDLWTASNAILRCCMTLCTDDAAVNANDTVDM